MYFLFCKTMWMSRFLPTSSRNVVFIVQLLCLVPGRNFRAHMWDEGILKCPLTSLDIARIRKHFQLECCKDTEAPQVTCPNNFVNETDFNQSTALVVWDPLHTYTADDTTKVTCNTTSQDQFEIGETKVVCTAYDEAGNVASCSFLVKIEDKQDPSIVCPNNQTIETDLNKSTAIAKWVDPVVEDNSKQIVNAKCDPKSATTFEIGEQVVTCTAEDQSLNSASCSFIVNITDTQDPTIDCPDNQTHESDPGQSMTSVTWDAPTTNDNTNVDPTVHCDRDSGSKFKIGKSSVECTALDPSGNKATCSFTVFVEDNEPPLLTCPANMTLETVSGKPHGIPNWDIISKSDNSGEISTKLATDSGIDVQLTLDIGETNVVCTVTDAGGNQATCNFTVFVEDKEAPILTCRNQLHETDPGKPSAVVTFNSPNVIDNSGYNVSIKCSQVSGSSFNIGQTEVICHAEDFSRNQANCSFIIDVMDTEDPSPLVCPNQMLNTSSGLPTARVEKPSTTDNSGTTTLTCTADEVRIGRSEVSCEASDSSGNRAHCNFTVDVSDNESPTMICPINQVLETSPTNATAVGSWASPKITDNSGQNLTAECNSTSGNHFEIGLITVTCRAQDSSGNKVECSFTIDVRDTIAPVLHDCPNGQDLNTDYGKPHVVASWYLPNATDNSQQTPIVTCNPASGSHFQIGTTLIGCKAEDYSKNYADCIFSIVVKDMQAPRIHCTGNQFFCTNTDKQSAQWRNPTVTDNSIWHWHLQRDLNNTLQCTKSGQPEVIDTLEQGTTNVTCTASDYSNNLANCTIPVTVEDTNNWGTWGAWGGCSVSCDSGVQTRVRGCSDDLGRAGGYEDETKPCTVATRCPHWSGWDSWNHCSVKCGYGVQIRERRCITTRDRCPNYEHAGYRNDAKELSLDQCQPEKQIELTTSTQSNVFSVSGVPGNAIDGRRGKCVHTRDDPAIAHWWKADMGEDFCVGRVIIWNRLDSNTDLRPSTMNTAKLKVGDNSDGISNPECAEFQVGQLTNQKTELTCNKLGRYLAIEMPPKTASEHNYLSFCDIETYEGFGLCQPAPSEREIQLTLPTQSSVFSPDGTADKAIDGNIGPNWSDGGCVQTSKTTDDHWWMADMGKAKCVGRVQIWTRVEIVSDQQFNINKAQLKVGYHKDQMHVCGEVSLSHSSSPQPIELTCNEPGRYLMVQSPSNADYMTFCEIKAYEIFEICTMEEKEMELSSLDQSSVYKIDGKPKRAIDGNKDALWADRSCILTKRGSNEHWWKADMGRPKCVGKVIIWKRLDSSTDQPLENAVLRVGYNNNGKLNKPCNPSPDPVKTENTIEFTCNMPGRYLSIHTLQGSDYLSFCEIEVYEAFWVGQCQKDFPKDCKEVFDSGNDTSGVYDIYPQDGGPSLKVYCDMAIDEGGWLVFQRRVDGSVEFNRDWDDYAKGFGDPASEHWLGNNEISRIAAQGTYELRVDLEDFDGVTMYAKYRKFQLGNACAYYTLLVSEYAGDAGDSLSHHNIRRFSTKDQDNDDHPDSCAVIHAGAWWYGHCLRSNLNGQYLTGPSSDRGIFWHHWRGNYYSLKRTEMKIRPIIG